MTNEQFRTQMNRLRKVYGDPTYPDELIMILWDEFGGMHELNFMKLVTECIATRPRSKPPLRNELRQIAIDLGFKHGAKSAWRYFDVADCLTCGGVGWYFIGDQRYAEATLACDDCRAGKNIQLGPPGTITDKTVPEGWSFLRPGRVQRNFNLHPELQRRFGSWSGLEAAIRERRMSTTGLLSSYIQSKGGGLKKASSNTDNPHHDKDLKF